MAQTPSKSCALCDKPATLYCYEDKQFLCSQCKKDIHDRVPVCRDHNVVDIHKAGNHIYTPVPVCDSHKKEFLYYCSKCDCLICKECITSSHNGHTTMEISKITNICRQDVDEIINKLKTKVEEIKKTLETIDGDHSFLIQSGCHSYIEVVEKTSDEIYQIVEHYKQIELNAAFDFRDTETHNLKGTRVFFQRLHNEFSDRLLKFENLLQEPHDNLFFLEWIGLKKEYQIMTEESEQPLASQRQMSGFNQDTFRRAVIDGIDQQFQMGLKELKTTVDVLKEEMDTLIEKLKGKQEEINNLSKLYKELKLKQKKETILLEEINKLKTEIKDQDLREFALQKEKETTDVRLTDEMNVLKEKLKKKQEQVDNLSKKKQHETTVARLTKEMDVSKTNLIRERKLQESCEISDATLVLIGFPGCGKSETGDTVVGKRVFKSELLQKQVTHDVLGLQLTVRDTTGFENMKEFAKVYNSLEDLECRKVVFGLTIRIGRSDPGFADTIQDIFNDKSVGEHLKRRTFVIFTCIDELMYNDEGSYEDEFEKWLRTADDIHNLITLFQLNYCVIRNEPGETKQFKHVEQIVRHIKHILEGGSEQERWFPYDFDKYNMNSYMPLGYMHDKHSEIEEDFHFSKIMDQDIKINPRNIIDIVRSLQHIEDEQVRSKRMHAFLRHFGSHMTENDVDKLLNLKKDHFSFKRCNIS